MVLKASTFEPIGLGVEIRPSVEYLQSLLVVTHVGLGDLGQHELILLTHVVSDAVTCLRATPDGATCGLVEKCQRG